MKLLTLNFLTCARKACKSSPDCFPLQPKDAVLEIVETDLNLPFLVNILPRLEWPAIIRITSELGLPGLKETMPEPAELTTTAAVAGEDMEVDSEKRVKEKAEPGDQEASQLGKDLHRLLMETGIEEGKLVCRNCGHEYAVKEGIANFLLPSHLV